MMPDPINLGVTLPGEQIIVAVLNLWMKMLDGMTPEQKQQLAAWYIEDVKAWRTFFGLK